MKERRKSWQNTQKSRNCMDTILGLLSSWWLLSLLMSLWLSISSIQAGKKKKYFNHLWFSSGGWEKERRNRYCESFFAHSFSSHLFLFSPSFRSRWTILFASYTLGPYFNWVCAMMGHEGSHGLVFENRILNKLHSLVSFLPCFVGPFGAYWWVFFFFWFSDFFESIFETFFFFLIWHLISVWLQFPSCRVIEHMYHHQVVVDKMNRYGAQDNPMWKKILLTGLFVNVTAVLFLISSIVSPFFLFFFLFFSFLQIFCWDSFANLILFCEK